MSKFNTKDKRATAGVGPIKTEAQPSGLTHEGAPGYAHDAKSELFLLAVSNFVGEDTFYEKAAERDARYASLINQVAIRDPQWTADFLRWLRSDANMRSAPLVGALHAAAAMVAAGIAGSRTIVNSVLQRADEPGEALAWWTANFGRSMPKPVKRGIADAAARLYNERSLLKYDTSSHAVRFADVLELTHPTPSTPQQGALFRYALDRRHGRDRLEESGLPTIDANWQVRHAVANGDMSWLLDADVLRDAGMTWEDALSLAGDKLPKAQLWEALIPTMGYMALLRNLRNFDEAGVSDKTAAWVSAKLADSIEVSRSRQFPYRFLAAYEHVSNLRWGVNLNAALDASLKNLPRLSGRSLVLIDTSGSMTGGGFSARSKMTPAKAAAIFGVALALRNPGAVDLYGFATGVFRHDVPRGASLISEVTKFVNRTGEVGHGTNIADSIQCTIVPAHDRVFVISDMQTMDRGADDAVPANTPLYGFNLGGYQHTAFPAGTTRNRHEFGGLTDSTFRVVPLLEAGRAGQWPWSM